MLPPLFLTKDDPLAGCSYFTFEEAEIRKGLVTSPPQKVKWHRQDLNPGLDALKSHILSFTQHRNIVCVLLSTHRSQLIYLLTFA